MCKKILFIINSLKNKSGTERVAINLANELSASQKYGKITLVNRDTEKNDCAYKVSIDIEVIALKGNVGVFFLKLKKLIKDRGVDYIVVHNMGKLSLLCSFLTRSNNAKLISFEHVAFTARKFFIQFLSKRVYKKFDQIVCLTNTDKESFVSINSNVCVIPNFSSFPITGKQYLSKEIIAVGRLTEQKNFTHLLQAWKIAMKDISPEWTLTIYGDGKLQWKLEEQISINQLHNVRLLKSVKDISIVYMNAAFLVMSSKYEGLPMVLIEAQTFGLPIVSYDCPHGPKEIIKNGVNGYLIKDQEIIDLANGIIRLTKNPEILEKMSKNSLDIAKNYQSSVVVEQWHNYVFIDK